MFQQFASIASLIVSLFAIASVFVAVGQVKQQVDENVKDIEELKKDLSSNSQAVHVFQLEFAKFSGEMRTTMKFIQKDLKDIKNGVQENKNAKTE